MSDQQQYDEWAASMIFGYIQHLIGADNMLTWSGMILETMKELKYHGWIQIKRNNLFYAGCRSLQRSVPPGRYRVWADDCRGIFVNPVAAYIIFPGV